MTISPTVSNERLAAGLEQLSRLLACCDTPGARPMQVIGDCARVSCAACGRVVLLSAEVAREIARLHCEQLAEESPS